MVGEHMLCEFGPLIVEMIRTKWDVDVNLIYTQPVTQVPATSDSKDRRPLNAFYAQFLELDLDTLVKGNSSAYIFRKSQCWFRDGHPLTACIFGEI